MVLPNEAFGDRLLQVAQSVIQQRQNQQRFELQQKRFMAEMEQQKRMMDARAGEIDAKQRAFDIQQGQLELAQQRFGLDQAKFEAKLNAPPPPLDPSKQKVEAEMNRRLRDSAGGIHLTAISGEEGFGFGTVTEFQKKYEESLKKLNPKDRFVADALGTDPVALNEAERYVELYQNKLAPEIVKFYSGQALPEPAWRQAYKFSNPNVPDDLIPPQRLPDPETNETPITPGKAQAVSDDLQNGGTAQLEVEVDKMLQKGFDKFEDVARAIREVFPNDPKLQEAAARAYRIKLNERAAK